MRRLILALALLAGCATLESASSGQIGCPTQEIKIADDELGWSSRTWTAHCRGRTYYCSAISTGKDSSQVSCKEQAGGKSATPAGCQYDTQCKGERVCRAGACVDP